MIHPKRNLEDLYRFPLAEESRRDKLRLEMNENICPLSEEDLENIRALLHPNFFNTYPEYHELYQQLASSMSVNSSSLLLTNGSDSASRLLFETFIGEGDEVLVTNPTFAMHRVYAEIVGASLESFDYSDNFKLDLDTFCSKISDDTRLCIVVNPNNPTGDLLSVDALKKLADHCSTHECILLIDEAYIDFSGESFAPHAPAYSNVIVTRTFSKAFGLAALRLGYVATNSRFAGLLRRTQPIFDVNNFAIECAKYILARPEILKRHHDTLNHGLKFLCDELQSTGYHLHPSAGNFILIRTNKDPVFVQNELAKRDILVSAGFSLPFLAPYLRISLGPRNAMEKFLNAFYECDADTAPVTVNSGE